MLQPNSHLFLGKHRCRQIRSARSPKEAAGDAKLSAAASWEKWRNNDEECTEPSITSSHACSFTSASSGSPWNGKQERSGKKANRSKARLPRSLRADSSAPLEGFDWYPKSINYFVPERPRSKQQAAWFVLCGLTNLMLPGLGTLLVSPVSICSTTWLKAVVMLLGTPLFAGYLLAFLEGCHLIAVGAGVLNDVEAYECLCWTEVFKVNKRCHRDISTSYSRV